MPQAPHAPCAGLSGGLAPKLVNSGKQGDSAVPDIASMVDEAMPHLHLCILEPGCGIGV